MVKGKLYWVLIASVALGSLLLFALLYWANDRISQSLTLIDSAHQAQLQTWADKAESYLTSNDYHELEHYLAYLNKDQQVAAFVLTHQLQPISGLTIPPDLLGKLNFQRQLDWPVHSHWDEVLIGIPLNNVQASFVVRLPDHMHPKPSLGGLKFILTMLIPLSALLLLTHFLYRYIIGPLRTLKEASKQLATATLDYQVRPLLGNRRDELSELADTFDNMACRIQQLVRSQRQLIGDLSHEIRTPLTRIRLLLSSHLPDDERRKRLEHEISVMQLLLDNAVLLARWDIEPEAASLDSFGLVPVSDLLTMVLDDVNFEFSDREIVTVIEPELILCCGSAFGMTRAMENIIRNAMLYSDDSVYVSAWQGDQGSDLSRFNASEWTTVVDHQSSNPGVFICVQDQGPGVALNELNHIFEPFYRIDKSRSRSHGGSGLGLPIVRQQVMQLQGALWVRSLPDKGFAICLFFPELEHISEL